MSYRTFKRRLSEFGAHDWVEWFSFTLGIAFFLLAVACVWGVVVAIASLGEADPGFKTTEGFLQATRGFGIVLFGLFGVVAAGVGWFLAGDTIRRLTGRLTRRG